MAHTYIPLDSWVYPALLRLYSLGYANTAFLSMRPYTRQALLHILEDTQDDVMDDQGPGAEQAQDIFAKLLREVREEQTDGIQPRGLVDGTKAVYERAMAVTNTTLRDSYHLGQTIVNDYGRPYEQGFNSITGFHEIAEYGRFSLDVRGEYEHSPAGVGYSPSVATAVSALDAVPFTGYNLKEATVPAGPIAARQPIPPAGRLRFLSISRAMSSQ